MENESGKTQQDGNLDDIMIEGGKGSKQLKKILMIVALIIVVLIIAIAATKVILGDSTQQEQAQTPPVAAPSPNVAEDKEPLFEEVPIEGDSKKDEELNQMINQLKEAEKAQQEETAAPKPAQESTAEAPAPEPEPEAAEETKAPEPKPATGTKHDPYRVKNGWYVQVGSFNKYAPNQGFLRDIEKAGYTYYFYRTTVKGTKYTKVLVGTYGTKAEAAEAKQKIRQGLNEGAFLVRVTDGV